MIEKEFAPRHVPEQAHGSLEPTTPSEGDRSLADNVVSRVWNTIRNESYAAQRRTIEAYRGQVISNTLTMMCLRVERDRVFDEATPEEQEHMSAHADWLNT